MAALDELLTELVTAIRTRAPPLCGIGIDTAAILLVAVGDNAQRLRNEAAWAHLCGVAPIEASSGKTVRHRLNRGGDRQANHALWRIVITRMSADARTKIYVARRLDEGRTKPEIIRVLKRYVAREVFKQFPRVDRCEQRVWLDNRLHAHQGCPDNDLPARCSSEHTDQQSARDAMAS